VAVTYETIGQWARKFDPVFAQELRRRGRRPGDKLHLDEVARKINGRRRWLWRAVDQHGFVVDILVQNRVTWLPPKPSSAAPSTRPGACPSTS
jgi:putative transposase